jgi:hypothetical protein
MYSLHIPPCLTYLFPRTNSQSVLITNTLPSAFLVLVYCDVPFELTISCKFSSVLYNLKNVKNSFTNSFHYTLQKEVITYSKIFTSLAEYIMVT